MISHLIEGKQTKTVEMTQLNGFLSVTASWVVAGIDQVTIQSLYQGVLYDSTKYRRL